MHRLLKILVAIVALLPRGASAADGYTMSLFNGHDLSGWHVTRCEAGVENGALVLQAGNGFVRTDHRYRDFILELDWKARNAEKWDSGIYIRSELPGETGRAWPTRYQINLAQGLEGNIKDLPGAASTGLVKPGEWNHFKITVIGKNADLAINGQPAWHTDKVAAADGYIGLQCEVPSGGQFEFRNLQITELGYHALLGESDLRGADGYGWEAGTGDASKTWKLADGVLECTGERGPWLRSLKQYGDFNLRLEYKLQPGGNSGVYVRVPHDGAHRELEPGETHKTGVEVQLLDDAAERYAKIEPGQFAASIYKAAPATRHVSKPAGQWNTLEIDCQGDAYRVTHNGVVVVDTDSKKSPELATRELRGYLGLQDHHEPVWFRNIRIVER
ncbi:MAG TPA: DUF1080 domain-containing protein [Pirellulales bacterium]|nr:DUF1080 domain-containing protein [Pirellulales bacterium]